MSIDKVSSADYISKVASNLQKKNNASAASVVKNEPDKVELSSNTNTQDDKGLKKLLYAIGGLALIAGGICVAKKFFIKPPKINETPTLQSPVSPINKIFKQEGGTVIEGVNLEGIGINRKATLSDGSLFTGTLEKIDNSGRKIITNYKDGFISGIKIISSGGKEIEQTVSRLDDGSILTKIQNADNTYNLKLMVYSENGNLKYIYYNPKSNMDHLELGKFQSFDENGKVILSGENKGAREGYMQIYSYDAQGKKILTKEMEMSPIKKKNVISGIKFTESIYRDGKLIKKRVSREINYNIIPFQKYTKSTPTLRKIDYVELQDKFGGVKVYPKTNYGGAGFTVCKNDGSQLQLFMQNSNKGKPECIVIFKYDKNIKLVDSWEIPIDTNKEIYLFNSPENMLENFRDIAELLKDDKNFTLWCGDYNIIDVLQKAINKLSSK